MLAAHPAAPVSRADLLLEVWGTSEDGDSNTVDVEIRSLRRKLGVVADRIETVRGVGYRLR
jgi:two-component system phosphate regulon response regulator PhoB